MSLITLIPPKSKDLTTVENVATFLGIPSGGAGDRQISQLIAQASATAAKFCERAFGVATYRETIRCSCDQHEVVLQSDPVIAVTSVKSRGVAMTLDMYEVEGSSLFSVNRFGVRRAWYPGTLVVEYVAGWVLPDQSREGIPVTAESLPADIEKAVMQLVAAGRSQVGRGDPMLKTTEIEGIGRREYYVQGSRAQLPHPEAEATLEHYRQMVLA